MNPVYSHPDMRSSAVARVSGLMGNGYSLKRACFFAGVSTGSYYRYRREFKAATAKFHKEISTTPSSTDH